MNARPCWVFFVRKKQQQLGEIALVTNLRPLMSEQLLKGLSSKPSGKHIIAPFFHFLR